MKRKPLTKEQIVTALRDADGSVEEAAAALKVTSQAIYKRMERLGIRIETERRVVEVEAA